MKTLLTYVLSLTLLLMIGYRYVNRESYLFNPPSKTALKHKKSSHSHGKRQLNFQKTASDDEKQSLYSVENEDDDVLVSKKNVQLVGYFVMLVYAAFILKSLLIVKNRPAPASRLLYTSPEKYLLQRALLI